MTTDELTAVRTHTGAVAWLTPDLARMMVSLGRCTLAPDAPPRVQPAEAEVIYRDLVRGLQGRLD